MSAFEVYFILTLLPEISNFLGGVVFISVVIVTGYIMVAIDENGDARRRLNRIRNRWFILGIISFFFSCIIPDTKTLIAMYVIPSITHNEQVKQLPDNILRFINNEINKENKQ